MSIYKADIKEAQQRLADWWGGKKVDRVVADVAASFVPAHPRVPAYIPDVPGKYIDPRIVFSNLEYRLERSFLGGESFPFDAVYLGPMFHLAYLGCEPVFTENTTWYEPCFASMDDLLACLRFDPQNRWWLLVKDLLRQSVERSGGRYLTSIGPVAVAMMDTLAGLVGTENLMVALVEEPQKVLLARDRLAAWARQIYEESAAIIAAPGGQRGTIDGMHVWSPKRVLTSQCDLCVMISPQLFRDFVVADLESTYAYVDHAIYHLDGEEELRHLDSLLAIDKIRLIQWIPSSRMCQPEYKNPLNWIPLFRRIQAAGKSVLIYCPSADVRALLQQIDRAKVFLVVGCADVKAAEQSLIELDRIGM
jgi:5-methyltetrahydrofolate--homocysteine methyltransferase